MSGQQDKNKRIHGIALILHNSEDNLMLSRRMLAKGIVCVEENMYFGNYSYIIRFVSWGMAGKQY